MDEERIAKTTEAKTSSISRVYEKDRRAERRKRSPRRESSNGSISRNVRRREGDELDENRNN